MLMVVVVIVKGFLTRRNRMSSREIVAWEAARKLGWRLNYLYSELRVGRFPGARKEGAIWLIPISQVESLIRRRQERSEKAAVPVSA